MAEPAKYPAKFITDFYTFPADAQTLARNVVRWGAPRLADAIPYSPGFINDVRFQLRQVPRMLDTMEYLASPQPSPLATEAGINDLPRYAQGGRPTVGAPAIVGEEGPEVFVPDQAGTIYPAWLTTAMAPTAEKPRAMPVPLWMQSAGIPSQPAAAGAYFDQATDRWRDPATGYFIKPPTP